MVVVLGPCFSLSASGLMGKALLYYDTKYGARVRIPKRTFVPPAPIWEINIVWFKAASDRAKTLTTEQKWAWQKAYPGKCDAWRDIFMGKQIEWWNLSPQNDLTWPPLVAGNPGPITANEGTIFVGSVNTWLEAEDQVSFKKWCASWVWCRVLDNAGKPVDADVVKFRKVGRWYGKEPKGFTEFYNVDLLAGHTNYIWGGGRLIDGRLDVSLVGSYVR